jgi:hypothetical protein
MRAPKIAWIIVVACAATSACTPTLVVHKEEITAQAAHVGNDGTTASASEGGAASEGSEEGPTIDIPNPLPTAIARIPVLTTKRPDLPAEVVGVLDFHTRADSEDKGFDELRWRAAQLGAAAVIGAEFEHGEGTEPSHLSGMAVRWAY